MRKILRIILLFLWLLLFFGVVYLVVYAGNIKDKIVCSHYSIQVTVPDNSDTLLLVSDVETLLLNYDSLLGKFYNKIDIQYLECILNQSPYIAKSNIYCTLTGNLNIFVTQRVPLVRVINAKQEQFYLDQYGHAMPIRQGIVAHVLAVNGNIEFTFEQLLKDSILQEVKNLIGCVEAINRDSFLRNQIGQIYIERQNNYLMIPVIGDHVIVLGNPVHPEIRLKKLKIFYQKCISELGWEKYKKIDLRFNKQTVCLK